MGDAVVMEAVVTSVLSQLELNTQAVLLVAQPRRGPDARSAAPGSAITAAAHAWSVAAM